MNNENKVSYKDTLNLPKTDFPIRANPKVEDKAMLERWQSQDLFAKSFEHNKGKEKFILHDGPPYANGNIHLGHAYNKILKDIVCKAQRMSGKHVPVTPGWDCHGLPIELKVAQEQKGLSPLELKRACRQYATDWINIQRSQFKDLGVLMNWDKPYLTMSQSYEASILKAFGIFVDQGYVERKNKTVPWCPSDQTVLASAEIEYQDRKDPSIYVLFPLNPEDTQRIFPNLRDKVINFLVWTTTPWTLPLNRALLIKPSINYVVLEINQQFVIVAKELADKVCALMNVEKKIIQDFKAEELLNTTAIHPFVPNLIVPIILDASVSAQDGTAVVHCAPGCGPEDYEVGIKNKLDIFSPISVEGKYTKGIQPIDLEGKTIGEGQKWVIEALSSHGRLFYKTSINHSYPHCWRCRGPLIFRATKQWFIDLSKNKLKETVSKNVDKIKMLPESSANRLKATLEGRLEWCISRQRVWGVPIVALICKNCDETYTSKNFIDSIAQHFEKEGIEYWDKISLQDLTVDIKCKNCNKNDFVKETDILDVWFDSGVSHYAVLLSPELSFPADLYLEGKDQHRGWFQSSLLTSAVIERRECTKAIVTHGFTVDELGKKMSKSLGNVISPLEIIERLGTDGLRLWSASIDLKDEAVVSEQLLRNVQEVFAKIRNTCRFLMSNLYDFDFEKDSIEFEQLLLIDKQAIGKLIQLNQKIQNSYFDYKFTTIFHELADYCTKDLSAFYLDIIKDRLYVEKKDGILRRSAQTTCFYILDTLTKLIAPILSFTAESISDNYQKNKTKSIHLQEFSNLSKLKSDFLNEIRIDFDSWDKNWNLLINIRDALLKAIEKERAEGNIKHSLESKIIVYLNENNSGLHDLLKFIKNNKNQSIQDFFKEFLIVSQFIINSDSDKLNQSELSGLFVAVERAEGDKCPRCWNYTITQHVNKLCKRCEAIT